MTKHSRNICGSVVVKSVFFHLLLVTNKLPAGVLFIKGHTKSENVTTRCSGAVACQCLGQHGIARENRNLVDHQLEIALLEGLDLIHGVLGAVVQSVGKDAGGGDSTSTLHRVTDGTGVGEVRELLTDRHVLIELMLSSLGVVIAVLAGQEARDFKELLLVVIGEIDPVAHSGHEVEVSVKHLSHEVTVSCEAHNEILVLGGVDELDEHLNHLGSVITGVLFIETVGLVDEEDATERAGDHLLGLGAGVADVLTHKIGTGGLNGVTRVDEAHLSVELAHLHGYGGLTSSGVSGEDVVKRRNLSSDTSVLSNLLGKHLPSISSHLILHGLKTDKLHFEKLKEYNEGE